MSISTIRPFLTMNEPTENGRPPRSETIPAAPLISARRNEQVDARPHERLTRDGLRTADVAREAGHAGIGAEHDIAVKQSQKRTEVTAACRSKERIDNFPLPGEIGVREAPPRLCTRRRARLASWLGAPGERPDDRRDLVKRHVEQLVQYKSKPFRQAAAFEHDKQRQADRVGENRFLLGVDALAGHDRVGNMLAERLFAAGFARPQMSRHTRATTVVSHPPRFSMPLGVRRD